MGLVLKNRVYMKSATRGPVRPVNGRMSFVYCIERGSVSTGRCGPKAPAAAKLKRCGASACLRGRGVRASSMERWDAPLSRD